MKTRLTHHLLAALLGVAFTTTLHAQLVADGDTLNLTTATNLAGNLTVGTNDGNTSLNIIGPGGAVTNAFGIIGLNATSTNNFVLIRNTGAIWNNTSSLYVGDYGSGNHLVVSDGAVVANNYGHLGLYSDSSNNTALITGAGSLWTNRYDLTVGAIGGGNQLVVSNAAVVANAVGILGYYSGSDSNTVVVNGSGSLWTNMSDLYVGAIGSGNRLVVSNGAVVANVVCYVGSDSGSSNNTVLITGPDSTWNNSSDLHVGRSGDGNELRLSSGGSASAAGSTHVGSEGGSNNLLHVDGGTLTVATNLDVRRGTLQLDSGTVNTANLLATNATLDGGGFITFNGGTLSVSNATVDNGAALVVGNGSTVAKYELLGNGLHTFANGLVVANNATLTTSSGGFVISTTIGGAVTVQSGGRLDLDNFNVDRLTLSNSPTLQGQLILQISKPAATTNDQVTVLAPLTYGGFLTVTQLSGTLTAGDSFPLFSASSYGGAFTGMSLPPLNPGLMWTNQLLINGSIAVVPQIQPSISGVTRAGTNLVFNVTGGPPGGERGLWTSPNIAIPLDSWQYLGPIPFDWLGNATVTNVINFAVPARFFAVGPTQN